MTNYNYVIIQANSPIFAQQSTLLDNNYKPTKYCIIYKTVYRDGSESITRIVYSNNLEKLQNDAKGYISWYNYVAGLKKNIQGYISEIN